jgi:hypothetical protein
MDAVMLVVEVSSVGFHIDPRQFTEHRLVELPTWSPDADVSDSRPWSSDQSPQ